VKSRRLIGQCRLAGTKYLDLPGILIPAGANARKSASYVYPGPMLLVLPRQVTGLFPAGYNRAAIPYSAKGGHIMNKTQADTTVVRHGRP